MSTNGEIGVELDPVLVQQVGQLGLANALRPGEGSIGGTDAARMQVGLGMVQWFAIGLFMFGFPAALFGMFFAHSYSWAFWTTIGIASLVIPPLLIVVTHGVSGAGEMRR